MKTFATSAFRQVMLWGILVGLCGSFAGAGVGQVVFFDTFDSEAVGSFPSTWTNVVPGPSGQTYVTNNVPGTPTGPNAFQISNLNTNEAFTVWRQFSQIHLNVISNVVIHYRLHILSNSPGGSLGFSLGPAFLPSQGEETFAWMRVVGNGSTWGILNPWYTLSGGANNVTNGLAFNTWYDFRFEIDPSPTNAQTGRVRWYINNNLVNTETQFTVPSAARTNINTLVVRDTFPASTLHPQTTFYLDNVRFFVEIPEPGTGWLIVLGALALFGRHMAAKRE